jgi:hypothetical protein
MERMQHHVAFTGNHPAFKLPFVAANIGVFMSNALPLIMFGVVEIKAMIAVVHVPHAAHFAVIHIHVAHHLPVMHTRHRLIAIFLHQRLHPHHVEHRIHRELQLALG